MSLNFFERFQLRKYILEMVDWGGCDCNRSIVKTRCMCDPWEKISMKKYFSIRQVCSSLKNDVDKLLGISLYVDKG